MFVRFTPTDASQRKKQTSIIPLLKDGGFRVDADTAQRISNSIIEERIKQAQSGKRKKKSILVK